MDRLLKICQQLASDFPNDDDGADDPAITLVQHRPLDVLDLAHEKIHAYHHSEVPRAWVELYTEAALWQAAHLIKQQPKDWVTSVVHVLDRVLIMNGGVHRKSAIHQILGALEDVIGAPSKSWLLGEVVESAEAGDDRWTKNSPACSTDRSHDLPPATKKLRMSKTDGEPPCPDYSALPTSFPSGFKPLHIHSDHQIPRLDNPTLQQFTTHISQTRHPTIPTSNPVLILNHKQTTDSPAFHLWPNPRYLFSKSLRGRRLVPVEVGRAYTDADWKPEIVSFGDFMRQHLLGETSPVAYLAQHDLLEQFSLSQDIRDPEFCSAVSDEEKAWHVKRNIWIGPRNTVSPLHHDARENILVQVFGYKYLRLYSREYVNELYPRGVDVRGVDMSNTSQIDLDELLEVDELEGKGVGLSLGVPKHTTIEEITQARKRFEERYPRFHPLPYYECILGPGQCLYIPRKWWHYVRSLTPSCSVSFWYGKDSD